MCIKPGKFGFSYTDASRQKFDEENSQIIQSKDYPAVVFFGDSLLWYVPLKREPVTWSWVNRGIPGDVTPFMVQRFAADVVQLHPEKVVILAGVNDLINALVGDEPYEKTSIEDAGKAVCEYVETMAAQATEAGIAVCIGSILPIETPMGKVIDNDLANAAIQRVNRCLQTMCEEAGYTYIDFYSIFVDQTTGCMNKIHSVDGIHLKKSGYRVFLDILRPFLD